MLAVPVINGGISPKDPLLSIACTKNPWQNRCKDGCSQPLRLLMNVEDP